MRGDPKGQRWISTLVLAIASGMVAHCRPQSVKVPDPAEPARCTISGPASPFLFGGEAEARSIGAALESGAIVLMAYDCDRLRVVTDCALPKSSAQAYAYLGIEPRSAHLPLASAQEVELNAPNWHGA